MSYMTLSDLVLVLSDLRENKQGAVAETLAYRLFGPSLAEMFERASSIEAALARKPLSEELKEADLLHDRAAKAVFYIAKGLLGLPNLSPEVRAVLERARDTFVPALAPLAKSYEDEAAAAKQRTAALEEMKPTLEAFPAGPGMSLYSLVADHINAGIRIDALLSDRAETVAAEDAARVKDAGPLRSQIIGTLGRFRDALDQEVSVNPSLPRELTAVTFSYYDQITAAREQRSHKPESELTPRPL